MSITVIQSEPPQRGALSPDPAPHARDWSHLPRLRLPEDGALQARLPAATAPNSAAAEQFDLLRTRVLGVTEKQGWSRVGLTQPRSRPAAAYAAANLAFSLARRPSLRVLLADLDLRFPRLTGMFGLHRGIDLGKTLRAGNGLSSALGRFGDNLAFAGNTVEDPRAAETLQEPGVAASVAALIEALSPDVALLLLPPVLEGDAGLAAAGMAETLLMVSDGTSTVPADLRHCDRLLGDVAPVLGLVLVDAEQ